MAVTRRKDRVMRILHTLPVVAQQAIIESLTLDERARYGVGASAVPPPTAMETTTTLPLGARPSPHPRYQEPPSGFQGRLPR
jgi:phospholipid/cholesterol/gamma-HCH transport system ATP-binding protein